MNKFKRTENFTAKVICTLMLTLSCGMLSCSSTQKLVDGLPTVEFEEHKISGGQDALPDAYVYSHFLKAMQAWQDNDILLAEKHFKALLRRQPRALKPQQYLFQILLAQGKVAEAFEYTADPATLAAISDEELSNLSLVLGYKRKLKALESLAPSAIERIPALEPSILAHIALLKGEDTKAEKYLKKAQSKGPFQNWAALLLSRLYETQGRYDHAVNVLSDVRALSPLMHWRKGLLLEILGDTSAADQSYRQIAKDAPTGPEARMRRVQMLLPDWNAPEPLQGVSSVIPFDAETIARHAHTFLIEGKSSVATNLFLDALQKDKKSPLPNLVMGILSAQTGKIKPAIEHLAASMNEQNPYFEDSLLHMSRIMLQTPDLPAQMDALEESILNGTSAEWQIVFWGRALSRVFGAETADKKLRTLTSKVHHPEVLYQYAMRLELDGKREEAMDLLRSNLKKDVRHSESLNYVAYSMAEADTDLNTARKLVYQSIQLRPWAGHILDSVAWVEYKLGNYSSARKWIELASDVSSPDPLIFDHYGDILLALDERNQAVQMYQKALQLDPTSELQSKIRNKIQLILHGKSL